MGYLVSETPSLRHFKTKQTQNTFGNLAWNSCYESEWNTRKQLNFKPFFWERCPVHAPAAVAHTIPGTKLTNAGEPGLEVPHDPLQEKATITETIEKILQSPRKDGQRMDTGKFIRLISLCVHKC